MEFSPDSTLLLLGGDSNNFCLYSVADKMLMKKFTITENRSLDGVVVSFSGNVLVCYLVGRVHDLSTIKKHCLENKST